MHVSFSSDFVLFPSDNYHVHLVCVSNFSSNTAKDIFLNAVVFILKLAAE